MPDQKEIIALLKNVALKNWQFVANAVANSKHWELSQYTAVSTMVVKINRQSVRDNAER